MRKINIVVMCLLTLLLIFALTACDSQTAKEDVVNEPQEEQKVVVAADEEETPVVDVAEEKETTALQQNESAVEDAVEHLEEEYPLVPAMTKDTQPAETEKVSPPVSDNSEEPAAPQQSVHQHSYNTSVTPATCTTKGYTTYTCACGHSYTANYNGGNGHSYKEVYENVPVYETVCITRCGYCHAALKDVGGVSHIEQEALAGNGGSSYQSYEQVLVGYQNEVVGYKCSFCGAER